MNQRDLEKAIKGEVERWPGVAVEFVPGGKHPKAKFTYDGQMLSRPFPGTPGDGVHGIHRTLADMRRIMKQLGATRDKPEPTKDEDEAPYRKPNDGAAKRPAPVKGEPAAVKPDVADQLVDAGVVTPDEAKAGRKVTATTDATVTASGSATHAVVDGELFVLEGGEESEAEARRAALRAQVDAIVDGVYFDLPAEVYHAVPRLSSSGLQKLCVSPATFWRGSWLDPDAPELDEEETKAQQLGKAYHTARLEPDEFHVRYCRQPDKGDYPAKGLLTSDAAIKAALKDLGEQQTCGATETIVERAQRLVDAGYTGTIWALVMDEHEAQRAGRIALPAKFFDQIVTDMDRMRESEVGDLLTDGWAEVSIFWTDKHGLKMKCRCDWLALRHWVDLKTFDNGMRKELNQALADAVRFNRLHVQAATYRDGVEALRVGGLDVQGEATEAQRDFVAQFRLIAKPLRCWFVFQEKGGVPNLLAREFEFHGVSAYRDTEINALVEEENRDSVREALGGATMLYSRALWEIDKAKREFVTYSQVYEPGRPWFPVEPMGKFSDLDFNTYWLEGKA
jgi:hypothetical protein